MPNIKFHDTTSIGAELFHEDGRIDMTKLMAAFRNFAKRAYNVSSGNRLRRCGMELCGPGQRPVAGSYEHCNERSGFTVCEEFYWLRN